MLGIVFRNTALRLDQQGVVTLTDDEREAMNQYVAMHNQLEIDVRKDITQPYRGWPTYKLIDRNGKVLDVNADPRNLDALARLLEQMK